MSSSGTPRPRRASANSQAPGSSSCSMRKRTSQPRSRRSGSSWSRWASEPEIPATFWVWSTTPSVTDPRRVEDATRPRLNRVARRHALAQSVPQGRTLGGIERGHPADPLGERARVPAREPLLRLEQLVEDRVGRENGQARGCGLVHDLVRRSGPHVVHERIMGREEPWDLGAWNRVSDRDALLEAQLGDHALELHAVRALVVGQRGPLDRERDVLSGERNRGDRDVESLRRRVAAEREQLRPVARARRSAGTRRGRSRARSPAASSTAAETSGSRRSSRRWTRARLRGAGRSSANA